mmetsp:Transcript_51355/g.120520  ORF Transcript_51355/g.120520 Transcript_51355/m.120520 type:complete len:131 (+) Transcript_51355:62-454(+)
MGLVWQSALQSTPSSRCARLQEPPRDLLWWLQLLHHGLNGQDVAVATLQDAVVCYKGRHKAAPMYHSGNVQRRETACCKCQSFGANTNKLATLSHLFRFIFDFIDDVFDRRAPLNAPCEQSMITARSDTA